MSSFCSFRSAFDVTVEALNIRPSTVVVIAEGIPERQAREMRAIAQRLGKWIIGLQTVGGFMPGSFKIGNAGGALSISNCPDCTSWKRGFCLKIRWDAQRNGKRHFPFEDGLYEGIAIGGDNIPDQA